MRKKSGAGGNKFPGFQIYYKATVIKTVWYWHKYRNIDQWSSIESSEMNPLTYGHLVYDKGGKNIKWRKDSLFIKRHWENWIATCERMKLEHSLTPYTKINLKWIKDLNIRPDTIKPLNKNIGRTLFNIHCSKIPFYPLSRLMNIKTKINKWDLIKLKNVCTEKETINNIRQFSEWGKIFANKITDKRLVSKKYKQSLQLNIKETNNLIKNGWKT